MPETTPTVEATNAALDEIRAILGEDAVLTGDDMAEFVDPYEPVSWGGQRNAAVVQPRSTEEVQAVVRVANKHLVPIWVGSQGRNNGYGGSGTIVPGSIVLNLRRMNRVLEINDELGYVVVEPGVSYNELYAAVRDSGKKVMIDPPDLGWGSPIGNAADHGNGYTKYGDHARAICGMEVVLPDGEIIRTGMGALPAGESSWHTYPKGYGPDAEQIFLQSNFGIITQAGFWTAPIPDAYLSAQIRVEEDADIAKLVDALRPLMLDGTIVGFPAIYNAGGILTLLGKRKDFWSGDGPIPQEVIDGVREQTGLGAWNGRFALYGRDAQVDESFAHVKKTLEAVPGVTITGQKYDGHDLESAELDQSGKVQAGITDMSMLSAVQFAGDNGGHVGFASVIPLTGRDTERITSLVREATAEANIDYTVSLLIGVRYAVHISLFFLNRDDDEHTRHIYKVCRETVQKAAELGYGEYRAHTAAMDVVSGAYSWNDHALNRFNERIKDAVDPNSILMPGRAGIWGARFRGADVEKPWLS